MTRVAHLLSRYPHPSHSFLRDEVLGLREAGLDVETIALNRADPTHVLTDLDRAEQRGTWYVKGQSPHVVLWAVVATAVRHPAAFGAFVCWAALQGPAEPMAIAKRTAQAIEAVLVHRRCRHRGVEHIHAHFAGAPGTVAWFASAWSRRVDRDRPLTWSITVHGPHDFMNERAANLPGIVSDAELVVAISDFTAAQLLRLVPADRRTRVQVVRCGIDLGLFTRRDRPAGHDVAETDVDTDTDVDTVPGAPLRVVTIGRMAPEKGQWVLVDAAARLVGRGVDVVVRIIGDGELRDELRTQIDQLGMAERISLLGVLDPAAIRAEIAEADIFCLPSFAEGLPIALMEAAAVGTPIVCTAVAGTPELVVDGRTGRCVPAGSAEALAAAIEQLAVDAPLRAKLADGGRAMVEARHDRRTTTARLASLLRSAATGDIAGRDS